MKHAAFSIRLRRRIFASASAGDAAAPSRWLSRVQKFAADAAFTAPPAIAGWKSAPAPFRQLTRLVSGALLALSALTSGCGSAPPAPPRQVQEYHRHTAVGHEKYTDGQIGEARSAFLRALARAELDDDSNLIATALLNLGASELLLDNADAAGRAYARASREARLAGNSTLNWQAISGLAEATRRLGQPAKALELLASRPATEPPISPELQFPAEITRARALADGGQADAALHLLAGVVQSAATRPPPDASLAMAWYAQASILLMKQETAAATAAAQKALALDHQRHHPPSVADDHRLLARIAALQNTNVLARHHWQRALTIYRNTGQEQRATESRQSLQMLSDSNFP